MLDKLGRIVLVMVSGSPMALVALGAAGPGVATQHSDDRATARPGHILQERSPGSRHGGVAQTKLARAAAPTERVLSGVRERPVAEALAAPGVPHLNFADIPLAGPAPVLVPVSLPLAVGGSGPFATGPVGGTSAEFVPGSAPGGPTDTSAPVVPAPPPAVPEPVTWMTLLTGLSMLASKLRRDRRASGIGTARRIAR